MTPKEILGKFRSVQCLGNHDKKSSLIPMTALKRTTHHHLDHTFRLSISDHKRELTFVPVQTSELQRLSRNTLIWENPMKSSDTDRELFIPIFTFHIKRWVQDLGLDNGHAYAKYADYAHMRNMRMRMRIENLIHIFHIQREKNSLFKRQ